MAKQLVEAGHNVEFFTRMPREGAPPVDPALVSGVRLHFIGEGQTGESNYLPSLAYAQVVDNAVRKFHQENSLDLLIATDFYGESFFLQCDPLERVNGKTVPIIMTLHGASRDVNRANRKSLTIEDEIICLQEEISIAASDMCLTPSRVYWAQLKERMPLGDKSVRVVPNFFNRSVFARDGQAADKTEGAPRKIVFVGRLEYRKGIDLLLEAFIHLAATQSNVELHIFGRDLEWPEYHGSFVSYWQNALPAELRQRCHFHGHQSPERLKETLQSAYVAVFPSRWEPFGIVALEAMAAGVPVVVTSDTGLAEIVGPEYELLVDSETGAQGLADVLDLVLRDEVLRSRVSGLVREWASQLWSDAHTGVQSALARVESGELSSQRKLPGALLSELQKLVLKYGAQTVQIVHSEIDVLAKKIQASHEQILRRDDEMLKRDRQIIERDETIGKLQAEIHRLIGR
jgi:glycosyltransferase involved in cell wall biosynthesis